jgi:hypothetical protein
MTKRDQLGAGMKAMAVAGLLFLAAGADAQATATKQSVVPAPPVKAAPAPQLPTVPGVELDRVVAIVNGSLILDSDVNEERRFEAILPYNGEPDFSRDAIVQRLVDRDLILQQARLQGGESGISTAELDKQIAALRKNIPACTRYQCETQQGWDKYLADNGFTEAQFDALWKQRMQVLAFIEERFRQGVRISAAEIKTYYEKTLVPQYDKQGVAPPKLEAISEQIRQLLLEQQVSSLLNDWLKSLRAEGQVVVLHPGEAAP